MNPFDEFITETPLSNSNIDEFKKILHKFNEIKPMFFESVDNILPVLYPALIHPSVLHKNKDKQLAFQRLEWMGDSVLGTYISRLLINKYPHYTEANLSRLRILYVRENNLAYWARLIGLNKVITVQVNSEITDKMLCDVVEALIGSAYLYLNDDTATKLVEHIFVNTENVINKRPLLNPKSTLQDWAMAALNKSPHYEVLEETGPKHKRTFLVQVTIDGYPNFTVRATGKTKQEAEEKASLMIFKEPREIIHIADTSKIDNPKILVQQLLHKKGHANIKFELVPEPGPSNAPFLINVVTEWGVISALGPTKREAEIEAACTVISIIDK